MPTTLINWLFRHISVLRQPLYNNKCVNQTLRYDCEKKMETESKNREMKHLALVRMAAIQVVVCASNLYDYAKRNSGPLRSTVGTVEGAVTAVVSPVYEKFKGVPDDLLVFLDHKVDEATHEFDKHAPAVAKQVVRRVQCLINKTSEKAQQLVNEARVGGPRAAVHFTATESKHFVVSQSMKVWVKLSKCPSTHKVADVVVPAAAHLSDKYNHFVKDMSQKGYAVFSHLPLVPVNEIAAMFKQAEAGKK